MSEFIGEKKHVATPQRRKQAREQGKYARSRDLSSALVLCLALAILGWSGPRLLSVVGSIMQKSFALEALRVSQDAELEADGRRILGFLAASAGECLWALLPLMAGVFGVAFASGWSQSGFRLITGGVKLDWNRVNPAGGAQRLCSLPNLVQLSFGLVKILLVLTLVGLGLWSSCQNILQSSALNLWEVANFIWDTVFGLCFRVALALLILGGFEYGFQWWQYEQDLRMTDEELREELKATTGNPQVLANRRARQQELAKARQQDPWEAADLVLTAGTEVAVGLKYDSHMRAPIVVQKQVGPDANWTKRQLDSSRVPILDRPSLAHSLRSVAVNEEIPARHYVEVAQLFRKNRAVA